VESTKGSYISYTAVDFKGILSGGIIEGIGRKDGSDFLKLQIRRKHIKYMTHSQITGTVKVKLCDQNSVLE
jgi:hypothetical protein